MKMNDKTMYACPLKIADCMRKMTLKVRIIGLMVHKIRLFFSIQFIKLAAIFAGCGLQIELDDKKPGFDVTWPRPDTKTDENE
jgi:hypothetical protein